MNTDKNNTQLPQSSVSVSAFLNGKAKQDFEVFQIHRSLAITNADRLENYKLDFKDLEPYSHHIWRMDEVYLIALIIEWLDTTGMFIDCGYYAKGKMCSRIESENFSFISTDTKHQTRKEALIEAIKKADELYNAKVVEAEH